MILNIITFQYYEINLISIFLESHQYEIYDTFHSFVRLTPDETLYFENLSSNNLYFQKIFKIKKSDKIYICFNFQISFKILYISKF